MGVPSAYHSAGSVLVAPVWLTMVTRICHMLYKHTRDYITPKYIAAHTLLRHTVTLQAVVRTW